MVFTEVQSVKQTFGKTMKLIKLFTLAFLLFTSLLNAQKGSTFLNLMQNDAKELNTNVSLDFISVDSLSYWVLSVMDETNYIIEDSGCKFVEATGETKITMSDTLASGYYKLKVTQDWTQGKLWAYNGTTTYNFPQSDRIYAVKIYLDGTEPLVIGCDNNTISIISSLSIK